MTHNLKRAMIALAAVAGLAAGGAGAAGAVGGDDEQGLDDSGTEQAITGPALDRASAAALDQTGGGTVTATEVGDEEGYYEVEVTKADGTQVDVHLNRDFSPAGTESDGGGDS